MVLGVCGEAGELAEAAKKYNRGDYDLNELSNRVKSELGDVLWYAACLSWWLGFDLEQIAEDNLDKLWSRHERGTIKGDGETR
jgi:NTP pyrophosphatase (non-canonical NTP hydrolase)